MITLLTEIVKFLKERFLLILTIISYTVLQEDNYYVETGTKNKLNLKSFLSLLFYENADC